MLERSSGVLLPVFSLWGEYGCGDFGPAAREFVDFLQAGGFSWWQVLPFCMTDRFFSPYKSPAAFGGNPFFISLDILCLKGLLTSEEVEFARQNSPWRCEYERLEKERLSLLRLAASRILPQDEKARDAFLKANPQVAKVAEFMALRDANSLADGSYPVWNKWTVSKPRENDLKFWRFAQSEFFMQWADLKAYANKRGVKILGDLPIYVDYDSCDVWANQKQFLLKKDGTPACVAGVPPDYFAEDGQLWKNPIYDWDSMKEDGFAWWSERIIHSAELFDGLRFDHFRGFASYWNIPAEAGTAREGEWKKGPGLEFVRKMEQAAGNCLLIAEDLGELTEDVEALLEASGFPGMRVLQFAFLGDKQSPHLPHNYIQNCVAYTGTHDNNTLLGFLWEQEPQTRDRITGYFGFPKDDWDNHYDDILRQMCQSCAGVVIFPIQDLLHYGADTRVNVPGVEGGENWECRFTRDQVLGLSPAKYREWNDLYGRLTLNDDL